MINETRELKRIGGSDFEYRVLSDPKAGRHMRDDHRSHHVCGRALLGHRNVPAWAVFRDQTTDRPRSRQLVKEARLLKLKDCLDKIIDRHKISYH